MIVDETPPAQEGHAAEPGAHKSTAAASFETADARDLAGVESGSKPAMAVPSEGPAALKPPDADADADAVAGARLGAPTAAAATAVAAEAPASASGTARVESRGRPPTGDVARPDSQTGAARDGPLPLTTLLKLYGWSLIPPMLFAGAYLLLLLGVLTIPMAWTSTTVSIDAVAEVFRFDVARDNAASATEPHAPTEGRRNALDDRFSILLPAGTYSLSDTSGIKDCPKAERSDEYFRLCGYAEPTTLRVRGAHLRFSLVDEESRDDSNRVVRITRLAIRVTPAAVTDAGSDEPAGEGAEDAARVQVVGSGERPLFRTDQWVEFESTPITYWRAPLQITNVTIGESLSELNPSQRILVDGSVRFFSRGKPWDGDPNRHLVYSEQFDRADSVTVEQSEDAIVGLVSFESATNETAARPSAFELVLHANRSGVEVERLGAQHDVKASVWMQLPPVWTAFWTVFSALTAVIGLRKYGRSAPK